jgi:hypothetical protein
MKRIGYRELDGERLMEINGCREIDGWREVMERDRLR